MNSGPNGEVAVGSWGGLSLEVVGWRVWFADGSSAASTEREWSELPDGVLAVYVYHPGGRRTRMRYVDLYPPPPGSEGRLLAGQQLGDLNSREWVVASDRITREAALGLPEPTRTQSRSRPR